MRPVAVFQLRENRSYADPLGTAKKDCQLSRMRQLGFQSLYTMASISILVPTMFFACNVEREGLLPGKNSA